MASSLAVASLVMASLFGMALAAPGSRVSTSPGLALADVVTANGDQATREQLGVASILSFVKGGGALEDGNLQPIPRVDSIANADRENRDISFQYFVDVREDITGSLNFHCSDVKLHVVLDGKEVYVTDWLGYQDRNPALPLQTEKITIKQLSSGDHYLTLIPEGRVGGCNTQGYVLSWGGTLAIFE